MAILFERCVFIAQRIYRSARNDEVWHYYMDVFGLSFMVSHYYWRLAIA